jgi:hypothetical protein
MSTDSTNTFEPIYISSYDELPSTPDHEFVSGLGIHCIFYDNGLEYIIQLD